MSSLMSMLNTFSSQAGTQFESNALTSQLESDKRKVEASAIEKSEVMTKQTEDKNKQEGVLDGMKKIADLQMQF